MISSRKTQPWVNVAIFNDVSDAQMLEMDLKDKGFETRTYNDKLLQRFLFLYPPHATIRVQVRGNDFKNVTYFLDHEPAHVNSFAKGDSLPVLRFIAGAISADDSQVSSADLIFTSRHYFSRHFARSLLRKLSLALESCKRTRFHSR